MAPRPRPASERFWSHVNVCGDDECWAWQGVLNERGYGRFPMVPRKLRATHRIAWELTHGAIPEGMFVCHRCDNPPCCNPAHLFVGTHQDNMADMRAKGRFPKWNGKRAGENNINARLTEDDVREIRRLAGICPRSELVERYGVGDAAIYRIQVGRAWAGVE